jgi:hypothetical protein
MFGGRWKAISNQGSNDTDNEPPNMPMQLTPLRVRKIGAFFET